MRFSARTWSIVSLLLFVAAILFWRKGNQIEAQRRLKENPPTNQVSKPAAFEPTSTKGTQLATLALEPLKADSLQNGKVQADEIKKRFPYRLHNTDKPVSELLDDDGAVLLANALIDTRAALPEIPKHLKAAGDPGSYIVQWKSAADAEFRGLLKEAGAEIISYVPNNAFYVKVPKAGADQLAGMPGVQTVMPFEPYYKLDAVLLEFAVKQEPLPAEAMLRLTLMPGTDQGVADEVKRLGGEVVAEERSPFGPQLIVRPALGSLVALAQMNEVQGIERSAKRKPASDLTRVTLGISVDGETNENYLGLTGEGTLVNINDVGIQPNHPTLTDTTIYLPSGPLGPLMTLGNDPEGHGTFVASLIAGNGANSPSSIQTNTIPGSGTNTNTVTNIVTVLPGSAPNPDLRGMAPETDLLMLPLDPSGPFADVSTPLIDTWLIESAAQTNYSALRRTNVMISNNSWTYGLATYDSSAARFDEAVRDALPGTANSQPLLFVFAAGNSGLGDETGSGGELDTIESPGTAKNVITVGALEALRLITNVSLSITNVEYFTNEIDGSIFTNETIETFFPFAGMTDSSTEVASFSSRGNVGIGVEGDFGRFKPDVVAPGTMLVSARSAGWNFFGIDTNDTNIGRLFFNLHTNLTEYRYDNGSTFAAATVSGMLALIQEYFQAKAPNGARAGLSPAMMKALLINGARPIGDYQLAVQSAANFQGWGLPNLANSLSSYTTNDHASVDLGTAHLRTVEQSAANAVVTGESRTWNVTLDTNASTFPMRVTLVWTDPPGNPSVGVKLVNDLDLVVTNLDTETPVVFHGNNFQFGGDVTAPVQLVPGQPEPVDRINNVENIVIRDPSEFGQRFSVTVRGRRVNVNAITDYLATTGRPNDVAQDFALVISSDMGADPRFNDTNVYLPSQPIFEEFVRVAQPNIEPRRPLTTVTNGLPLLEQRIGGNPTLVSTNGVVGQWNFYVFTNITVSNELVFARAGSNVAFVTFNSPNLAKPRAIDADVDLYVSTDERLTNLNPVVVASAFKSRERGGIETVVFSNAPIGRVYYIGVKSEDQQAAEYSFMGVSSDLPFEEERNGKRVLRGVPLSTAILDGTARKPTAGTILAIGTSDRRVANVAVQTSTFHENFPDLVGVLSHSQTRTILNNHSFLTNGIDTFGTNTAYYSDNPMFPPLTGTGIETDGPGSLNDFAGQKITGAWFIEMIDNTPGHTGRVEMVEILVDPLRDPLIYGDFYFETVGAGQVIYFPVDVPPAGTNLVFTFRNVSGPGLDFLFRQGLLPTTNEFGFRRNVAVPGDTFSIPVIGGQTYFVGLRNPTGVPISFEWRIEVQLADDSANRFFARNEISPVPDAVTLGDVVDVNIDKLVADVQVGVRMKHPRTADIVLSLISPQGTRLLLAENRGYTNASGFGSTRIVTNTFTTNIVGTNGIVIATNISVVSTQANYVIFSERTNATTAVKFANPGSSISLGTIGVPFANGFEGSVLAGNYDVGTQLAAGWQVVDSPLNTNTPSQVSVINYLGLAHTGDTLMSLGTAGLQRRFPITMGKPYVLKFAARSAKVLDLFSTGVNDAKAPLPGGSSDPHYFLLQGDQTEFPGPIAYVLQTNQPPFVTNLWSPNTPASQWIAPYPVVPAVDGFGPYVFRTYIDTYEQDPRTAIIPAFRWSADDRGFAVRVNGVLLNYASGSPTNLSGVYSLGGIVPGLNTVDFFVSETNGVEGVRVEALNGVQPVKTNAIIRYTIGGVTRSQALSAGWQTYEIPFVPTNALETLTFITQQGEVWLDTVSVETGGDVYVLPEEPFDLFDGERAMGEWRLEVRDSRTGAVLPASEVLEWALDLSLAETPNKATLVRNGFLDFFEVRTNNVHYVILDPCRSASLARLTITGDGNFDGIEMRADWSGFPTGNSETEDFAPVRNNQNPGQANGRLVFELNRSLPAPATLTGKPLYLAIYNRFQNATNQYEIDFVSDGDCAPLTPPPDITPGGPPVPGVIPPGGSPGTNTATGLFQFDVGPNVRAATVTVVSDGDVSVYALEGEPPTRTLFSHSVDDVNIGGTEVLVIRNTDGSQIVPGTWYVRIANDTGVAVNYTVTVTFEYLTPPDQITVRLVPLSNGELRLQWDSTVGSVYEVLESTSPAGPWTVVATITASSTVSFYPIDRTAPGPRFYLVRLRP